MTTKQAARKSTAEMAKSYQERREAILAQFMKDHPALTKAEALQALEAEGF